MESITEMNWHQSQLLNQSEHLITDHTQWAVLCALISFADNHSAECYAGKAKIARRARFKVDARGSSRTVDKAIHALIQQGHISLVAQGGGSSHTNRYKIHINVSQTGSSPNPASQHTNPAPQTGPSQNQTPHPTPQPPPEPRVWDHPLKEEDKTKRNEELSGGGESNPPPPHTENLLLSPIGQAIFQINGTYPNLNHPRDRLELQRLAPLLAAFPSEAHAAAEIERRFTFWDKPTPPQLSQIVSQWHVMERIAQSQLRHQQMHQHHERVVLTHSPHNSRQRSDAHRRAVLAQHGIEF